MKVIIAGASGFIGSYLVRYFSERGGHVIALSRNPDRYKNNSQSKVTWKKWINDDFGDWIDDLNGADVVINLIGETIAGKRWTAERKKKLKESRVAAGRLISRAIDQTNRKPGLLIQASAIGIYEDAHGKVIDESATTGQTFLSDICVNWEKSTASVDKQPTRRYIIRIGLVIGKESFLLKMLKLQFNLFAGGHIGSGMQGFSWVHIDDVVKAIAHIISQKPDHTVYNLTAPEPVSMKDFCKTLGKVMHRPSWLPVPAFAVKILYGKEMAEETVLSGNLIKPENLLQSGYQFQYPKLKPALQSFF